MIKTYYMLTKPGIIIGNAITMAGGFALGSKIDFNFWLFLITLLGVSTVVASAGVFNNYFDQESDKKMERTKNRPLVKQLISEKKALIFATLLGFFGISILMVFTNWLVVWLTVAGFLMYVILYMVWKYTSVHGTLVGSLSGAMPPVIGYTAASQQLDLGAFLIFIILVCWQMPHFFAIAIYRLKDYTSASIPVMPAKRGIYTTQLHMVFYIFAFIVSTLTLTYFNYTGILYMQVALALGLFWLGVCLKGFRHVNHQMWARQMFVVSLFVIMGLCFVIPFDVIQ